MDFYTGLHHPWDAENFDRAFVSVNTLRRRRKPIRSKKVILDSGAFTELCREQDVDEDGNQVPNDYRDGVNVYAAHIRRIKRLVELGGGELEMAVSQDYMCEEFILAKTGRTITDHQKLTIERYDALIDEWTGVLIMPVLQGYAPEDYVRHIGMYGDRLTKGMRVGVGSVCKRNADPRAILDVLTAIKLVRPDLRLHGFGLKITALSNGLIRALLYSADSMAWSLNARMHGRNPNDWREADAFRRRIAVEPSYQGHLIEVFDPIT